MDVLLVGEDTTFLSLLALDLSFRGFAVRTVTDGASLGAALVQKVPEVVVFDHVEPMDLFALNPRDSGYDGPLILLIGEDKAPYPSVDRLRGAEVVTKPLMTEVLSARIRLLVRG